MYQRQKEEAETRSLLILYSFCGNSSLALYCFSGASSLVLYSFSGTSWEQKRDHSHMILCRCAARSCYDLHLRRGREKGGAHWLKALSHSLGRKRGRGGQSRLRQVKNQQQLLKRGCDLIHAALFARGRGSSVFSAVRALHTEGCFANSPLFFFKKRSLLQ